jgi:hypothetical protein
MPREPMLAVLEENGMGPEQAVHEYERLLVLAGHLLLLTVPMEDADKIALYAALTCEGTLTEESLGTIQRVARKRIGPRLRREAKVNEHWIFTLAGLERLSKCLLSRVTGRRVN